MYSFIKNLNFKIIFGIILSSCFLCVAKANANVVEEVNMKNIEKIFIENILKYGKENILGVFDVDMVLTQPAEPEAQMKNIFKYYEDLKMIMGKLSEDERQIALNFATKQSKNIFIDNYTKKLIENLQNKNIKIITLTDSFTGKMGGIEKVEEWRYAQLKDLGIDFSNSFLGVEEIVFYELPAFLGNYPMYYKGNLLTNASYNSLIKGKTLKVFLNKINYFPKVIIFIDDKKENLEEMKKEFKDYSDIKVVGIHYKGAINKNFLETNREKFISFWQNVVKKAEIEYKKIEESKNEL